MKTIVILVCAALFAVYAIQPACGEESNLRKAASTSNLKEPILGGKPVSSWLLSLYRRNSSPFDIHKKTRVLLDSINPKDLPDVQILAKGLESAGANKRLWIAWALYKKGDDSEPVLPLLIEALSSPDFRVNKYLLLALRAIDPKAKRLVPALLMVLMDETRDYSERKRAGDMLCSRRKKVIPHFLKLLKMENDVGNDIAASCLAKIHMSPQVVIPALLDALRIRVRNGGGYNLAEALGTFREKSEPAIPVLLEMLEPPKKSYITRRAAETLGLIGMARDDVIQGLEKACSNEDECVQRAAFQSLVRIHPDILKVHLAALGREGAECRLETLRLLKYAPEPYPELVTQVASVLGDAHPAVTLKAAELLANYGTDASPAIPALIECLAHENRDVIEAVIEALARTREKRIEGLANLIYAQPRDLRFNGMMALVQTGDPAWVLTLLLKALEDGAADVRNDSACAIGRAVRLSSYSKLRSRAIPPLIEALRGRKGSISIYAARALKKIGNVAIPDLISTLMDPSRNPLIRIWVARTLGAIKNPAALSPLLSALSEGNPDVRGAVVQALGGLRMEGALAGLLVVMWEDSQEMVQVKAATAILRIRSHSMAEKYLIDALKSGIPAVREQAAEDFRRFKIPGAVEHLVHLLNDPVGFVRRTAADTLGHLGDVSAVPALIEVLENRKFEDLGYHNTVVEEASMALRKITGENIVLGRDAWLKWWEEKGREIVDWEERRLAWLFEKSCLEGTPGESGGRKRDRK